MLKLSILILFSATVLSAHSGRTDSCGGHWCTKTGTYHYHADPIPHQQAKKELETKLHRQEELLPLVKKG